MQLSSFFFFWLIFYAVDFSFEISVLPYSIAYATVLTMGNIGTINALKSGPVSLTSLFVSLSLILTTIWGFFFWNTQITVYIIIGLICVVISIILCLYTGKKNEEQKITLKWIFFVSLAFLGNAGCYIIQRTQQMNFNGLHGNMLMTFASFLAATACLIIYLFSDKSDSKAIIRKSWQHPVVSGGFNVVVNLFIMLLANSTLSPSLIYPAIGVGSLMIVTLFSFFVFKERLKWWQWLGIVFGATATALLSI